MKINEALKEIKEDLKEVAEIVGIVFIIAGTVKIGRAGEIADKIIKLKR